MRGVIFLKIRLSKLGAEKRGPGGGLGRPFWGPRWGQNRKNEVRKVDRKMSYFLGLKKSRKNTRVILTNFGRLGGPALEITILMSSFQ